MTMNRVEAARLLREHRKRIASAVVHLVTQVRPARATANVEGSAELATHGKLVELIADTLEDHARGAPKLLLYINDLARLRVVDASARSVPAADAIVIAYCYPMAVRAVLMREAISREVGLYAAEIVECALLPVVSAMADSLIGIESETLNDDDIDLASAAELPPWDEGAQS